MKQLLVILIVLISGRSYGTVYTSFSDGNWSDSATWTPLGIPGDNDTIDIQSNVLITSDFTIANCEMIVQNDASLSGSEIEFIGSYALNFGTMTFLEIQFSTDSYFSNSSGSICNCVLMRFNSSDGIGYNQGWLNAGSLLIYGAFWINYGQLDVSYFYYSGDNGFQNEGSMNCETLINGGNFINDSDTITASYLFTYNDFENRSLIIVTDSFKLNQDFINQPWARIRASNFIGIDPTFRNDGELICNHFTFPDGDVYGYGKICISGCAELGGWISWDLDVCDLTPNGSCDTTYAGIDSTVTFCAVSPCEPLDLAESSEYLNWKVYPNPTEGWITIELSEQEDFRIQILDPSGKTVYQMRINKEQSVNLNLKNLASGQYFLRLSSNRFSDTKKLHIR
ncbi:T9SS type A sorting domain-containing protein [bacterium AH-315-C20]|nr:T9SS type A sorting domain-containing protein [bacterium AH-315-C20]